MANNICKCTDYVDFNIKNFVDYKPLEVGPYDSEIDKLCTFEPDIDEYIICENENICITLDFIRRCKFNPDGNSNILMKDNEGNYILNIHTIMDICGSYKCVGAANVYNFMKYGINKLCIKNISKKSKYLFIVLMCVDAFRHDYGTWWDKSYRKNVIIILNINPVIQQQHNNTYFCSCNICKINIIAYSYVIHKINNINNQLSIYKSQNEPNYTIRFYGKNSIESLHKSIDNIGLFYGAPNDIDRYISIVDYDLFETSFEMNGFTIDKYRNNNLINLNSNYSPGCSSRFHILNTNINTNTKFKFIKKDNRFKSKLTINQVYYIINYYNQFKTIPEFINWLSPLSDFECFNKNTFQHTTILDNSKLSIAIEVIESDGFGQLFCDWIPYEYYYEYSEGNNIIVYNDELNIKLPKFEKFIKQYSHKSLDFTKFKHLEFDYNGVDYIFKGYSDTNIFEKINKNSVQQHKYYNIQENNKYPKTFKKYTNITYFVSILKNAELSTEWFIPYTDFTKFKLEFLEFGLAVNSNQIIAYNEIANMEIREYLTNIANARDKYAACDALCNEYHNIPMSPESFDFLTIEYKRKYAIILITHVNHNHNNHNNNGARTNMYFRESVLKALSNYFANPKAIPIAFECLEICILIDDFEIFSVICDSLHKLTANNIDKTANVTNPQSIQKINYIMLQQTAKQYNKPTFLKRLIYEDITQN